MRTNILISTFNILSTFCH